MSDKQLKLKAPESTTTYRRDGYSYEYECIGYTVVCLKEMTERMNVLIRKKAEEGYRYVESVRLNTSEGIFVFERKK